MRTKFTRSFAVLALALSASPSLATPPGTEARETTVRINYSDLDLSRPDDVETLKKRVARAISKACWTGSSLTGADLACERPAKERAMREIERHRLRYAALTIPPAG